MPIEVVLDGQQVAVDADVFDLLFENSVVAERAPIAAARRTGRISFRTLVGLARDAEVPYPLFFAPVEVVEEQIRIKTKKLMAGFTAREFSMNSRHQVHVSDIELIVKDLLRKQQYLRKDVSLARNAVIGCISRPGASARQDAETLMSVLALGPYDLRDARNKEGALELLINRLEARQVLVARSARNFMPQRIPRRARFSGITVKDTKVPFIFLATGDEGEHVEPAGRKMFTLVLLAVLIGRGTFAPVTYDAHTTEEATQPEYDIVGEVLLPARHLSRDEVGTLEGIKSVADLWKVTPSAVAIRAHRLGLIARAPFLGHMEVLREEYASRQQPTMRSPLAVNALRRYNGLECSRRMLGLLDAGQVNSTDFCRLMFSNKLRASDIDAFRAAVS